MHTLEMVFHNLKFVFNESIINSFFLFLKSCLWKKILSKHILMRKLLMNVLHDNNYFPKGVDDIDRLSGLF